MDYNFLAHENSMLISGPIEIVKRSILLMVSEFLSKADNQVIYITKSYDSIPKLLHGTNINKEYFGKVQFRYVKSKELLISLLTDTFLHNRLKKIKFTIILDGLENFCNENDFEDIIQLNAILIGATPKMNILSKYPRIITCFNHKLNEYQYNQIFDTFYSNICHIYYKNDSNNKNIVCLNRNRKEFVNLNESVGRGIEFLLTAQ